MNEETHLLSSCLKHGCLVHVFEILYGVYIPNLALGTDVTDGYAGYKLDT